MQSLWRGHCVRRRWRPVIRLHVRHGRRACIRPYFASWVNLARVHKWARRRFDQMQGRWVRSCFDVWIDWTRELAAEKQGKLERAARTLKNVSAYRAFRSWHLYTRAVVRANRLFAHVITLPALGAWIRHTNEAKEDRRMKNAAITIQRHARGHMVCRC